MKDISFSWKNYTRPTPKNLEFVFELVEDTLKFATAFSVWEEVDPWIPISILTFAFICGKLKKFFASAAGQQEQVTVSYPSEIADKIEVTQETKDPE
jgi:hypothetical protein